MFSQTLSEFELDIETIWTQDWTELSQFTIWLIWLLSTFSSLRLLSLIFWRGVKPDPAFLIYRMICLSYYTPSCCKPACKIKSQWANCSREAWPAETGKMKPSIKEILRGLIKLWPHHDLRTKRNETDHYLSLSG